MTEMARVARHSRTTPDEAPSTEHSAPPIPADPFPLPVSRIAHTGPPPIPADPSRVSPIRRLRKADSTAPHKELKDLELEEVRAYHQSPALFVTSDESERQALSALAAGYAAAALWNEIGAHVDVTGASDTEKARFYGVVKALDDRVSKAQDVITPTRNFKLAAPMKGVSRELDAVLKRAWKKESWIQAADVAEANWRDVLLAMPKPAPQQAQGSPDKLMSESEIAAVIKNCNEVCDFAKLATKETDQGTHKQINTALSMAANEVRNASRRAPDQLKPDLEKLDKRIDKYIRRAVTLTGADFQSCDSALITFEMQLQRVRAKFAKPTSTV